MVTKVTKGRVIQNGRIEERDLFFENGIIVDGTPAADQVIDAEGLYVSPGFIDIHVHGGGGHDFMDGTEAAFRGIAEFHARYGTTAMCPTTLSGELDETISMLKVYKAVKDADDNGSDFIGIHLEGPYFALSKKGAQDEKYVHAPSKEEYEKILNASTDIVRWSAAPEMDMDYEFSKALRQYGILPSAGHTDANCRQMLEAAEHGYTHMTHLYSGMDSVVRVDGIRIAGAVEAAYLHDGITVEIIADGMHLPHELLLLVYKFKGAERTALITDAMRGAGSYDGQTSILGSLKRGQEVFIEDGVAWMPHRQAFAGSIATFDRLVRTMLEEGVPLPEVIRMASETPAKIIGCHRKGTLDVGKDADIVLFDDNIRVVRTIVRGKTVFSK